MPAETLKDISTKFAKKQPLMVEALTEEAPILEVCKWKPATHQAWNVAEKITDITGPSFVNLNAPLPIVGVSGGLEKIDLSILGGDMQVPKDTADIMGGPAKYFADRQAHILRKAGNDTEQTLYYKNWLAYARDNTNIIKAGTAASTALNSLVVCRFDEAGNTGLYDPTQFDQGTLLKVSPLSGGNLMPLNKEPFVGVNGYGVELRGRFGWQLLNEKSVAAVVNINSTQVLTAMMIDDAVAKARGRAGTTYIFCHPLVAAYYINPIKVSALAINVKESGMNTMVDSWNGIPIVTSYNLLWNAETAVA